MVKNVVGKLGGIPEYNCSAKEGTGVSEVFNALAEKMMDKAGKGAGNNNNNSNETTVLVSGKDQGNASGGCC